MTVPTLSFVDRVIFNAANDGTGLFVETDAAKGFQTMEAAGAVNGTAYGYAAQSHDLTAWEVGYGTWTTSTKSLTRTVLYNSLGTQVPVGFDQQPQVMITALAESLPGPQGPQGIPGTGGFPFINVADFGAVGDGSTNDGPAIQAAIDSAFVSGISTIFLPSGKYNYNFPLFLDAPANGMRGNPPPTVWSIGTTYALNDTVTFAGVPFKSLQNGNIGNTPRMFNQAIGDTAASAFWVFAPFHGNNFSESLRLVGDGAAGSFDSKGATLFPQYEDAAALCVGPGQGMRISSINIRGQSFSRTGHRCLKNIKSNGITIPTQDAGVTRTMLDYVTVTGFYTGIGVDIGDLPGGGLGDSTTLFKCCVNNCHTGLFFGSNQSYANTIYECVFGDVHWAVWAMQGNGCNVVGGNISAVFTTSDTFGLAGVTNLASTTPGIHPPGHIYTFDAVLTAPAWDFNKTYNSRGAEGCLASEGGKLYYYVPGIGVHTANPTDNPGFGWVGVEDVLGETGNAGFFDTGIFNFFLIPTANFGYVPCECIAYDIGSNVATFSTKWWHTFEDFSQDLSSPTDSDLLNELNNATEVLAVEVPTLYKGNGINVYGAFTEMTLAGPCAIASTEGFFGERGTVIDGMFADHDISCASIPINNPVTDAPLLLSPQHWPAFYASRTPLTVRSFGSFSTGYVPAKIEQRFTVQDASNIGLLTGLMRGGGGIYEFDTNAALPGFIGAWDGRWTFKYPDETTFQNYGNINHSHIRTPGPVTLENMIAVIRVTQGLNAITHAGTNDWTFGDWTDGGGNHAGDYPILEGQKNYPIAIDQVPYTGQSVYPAPQERVYVVNGVAAAGPITATGVSYGQVIAWATDLTAQVEATSFFGPYISSNNQITQVSSSNLSAHVFQICVKTPQFIRSSHFGFSYGQDFTNTVIPGLSWSFKTASCALYLTATNPADPFSFFVPGVRLILNIDSTDTLFYVIAVFQREGYVTIRNNGDAFTMPGTGVTTIYTGTTIKQQPFKLSFS